MLWKMEQIIEREASVVKRLVKTHPLVLSECEMTVVPVVTAGRVRIDGGSDSTLAGNVFIVVGFHCVFVVRY